eukprot:GHVR01151683.1.p1 GENE.GHVR01151683.1~~GHVR01151683.1.p1  ORF type:complete len:120 (+),score=11.70 GHVR01151683.1:63-422(+)
MQARDMCACRVWKEATGPLLEGNLSASVAREERFQIGRPPPIVNSVRTRTFSPRYIFTSSPHIYMCVVIYTSHTQYNTRYEYDNKISTNTRLQSHDLGAEVSHAQTLCISLGVCDYNLL